MAHPYLRQQPTSAKGFADPGQWRTHAYAIGQPLRRDSQTLANGAPIPTPPANLCDLWVGHLAADAEQAHRSWVLECVIERQRRGSDDGRVTGGRGEFA